MSGHLRQPELTELETFVLAVEEGSIARAAARLGISSPAAAKRIRQLELLAQAPLLHRGRRGVRATEAGLRLYPVARELVMRRADVVAVLGGAPAPDALRRERLRHRRAPRSPARGDVEPKPNRQLAVRYLAALRQGKSLLAASVAEEALSSYGDVAHVHSHLIAPAMTAIGDLWERNVISIADEHLATEISEKVAARLLFSVLGDAPRWRERVLMAAVQGEHHVLGLRLVADVLEGSGYDVLYLGADVPTESLLDACRAYEPQVLGLTVTMPLNIPTLVWEIAEVAKLARAPHVMIGGRAAAMAAHDGLDVVRARQSGETLEVIARLLAEEPTTSRG